MQERVRVLTAFSDGQRYQQDDIVDEEKALSALKGFEKANKGLADQINS